MRNPILSSLLVSTLLFASCGGGGNLNVVPPEGPQPPINNPDTGVFNPGGSGGGGTTGGSSGGGGTSGSGSGTGGSSTGGSSGTGGTTGGTGSGGGSGASGGGGGSGSTGGGTGGGVGNGGGSGSQPVPEPGTLILFGSGLAGIGASIMRRRKGPKVETDRG